MFDLKPSFQIKVFRCQCRRVLRCVHIVAVTGWKVDHDLGSIDTLPPEVMIRKLIHQTPAHFLSQESRYSNMLKICSYFTKNFTTSDRMVEIFKKYYVKHLRNLRRIPERIGKPEFFACNPKLVLIELLSIVVLSHEPFSTAINGIIVMRIILIRRNV